ncbi:MAG: hypothetical protein HFE76_01145 [Firmicutes bacterium]|nr:hypothetical protein [Bacillota bacterium]
MEEIDIGVSSIAVPLFNTRGELKGTLSIAASAAVVNNHFKNILTDLKQARNIIEYNRLGR